MKLKYISWVPAVLIMGMIFCFSSKPAAVSEESSLGISNVILKTYETVTKVQMPVVNRVDTLSYLDHIVRKTAHFMEYAALAAAFALHFTLWEGFRRFRFFLPVILAGFYAAADEYHQTFIAGRSGQLSDVFLDTSGAVAGVLVFSLLVFAASRKNKEDSTNSKR